MAYSYGRIADFFPWIAYDATICVMLAGYVISGQVPVIILVRLPWVCAFVSWP